jgi:hypothetical protein|tara:strand:+ start:3548 stop:3676 length:129 start_codon:yes stop_codon:yes gene_type:complete
MKRIVIELDVEDDEVSDEDIYDYLDVLMENECLHWTVQEGEE